MLQERNNLCNSNNKIGNSVKSSRKWTLTINNPEKHGYTIESVVEILDKWEGMTYWCLGSETGVNENTPHYHVMIYSVGAKRFDTVKKKFPTAHIEACKGTIMENRDYCWKTGKWKDTEKGTLHDYESNRESGTPPEEKGRGHRTDLNELYDMIKDGMTDFEIMEECPQYIQQFEKIDKVRQMVKNEQFADCWRELKVVYIWGTTGAGKTRYVMDTYGYRNVYRVTDYYHPFDHYQGEDVVIFEEFRSSLYAGDMLKYLDGYPVKLPARYNNKTACFTKVYIISNIDIRNQYPTLQREESETWNAFLRRINEVWYTCGKEFQKFETSKYIKDEWRFINENPFEDEKGA